jgi:hypothetical protein
MGRNYLKGREGDRINTVMAAAGYNFSLLLLRWLERLLPALISALLAAPSRLEAPKPDKPESNRRLRRRSALGRTGYFWVICRFTSARIFPQRGCKLNEPNGFKPLRRNMIASSALCRQ